MTVKKIYIYPLIFISLILGFFIFKNTNAIMEFFVIRNNNATKVDEVPLVVALMVKNEENVIVDTLKPFVEVGIDSFFIYDTGSTDKTIEMVKNFFKEKNIKNSFIIQEPFVDYSTSRNKALDLIEKQFFVNSSFILMPDAEWYITNANVLVEFCKNNKNIDAKSNACFAIKMIAYDKEYYMSRLIKTHSNTRFQGRVHESLNKSFTDRLTENIYFTYKPKQKSFEESKNRWLRDKDWLLEDHLNDPKNERLIFLLAQTYADLQDYDNAIKYYKLYLEYDKQSEFVFLVYYTLGKIYDIKFSQSGNDKEWNKEALNYYVNAFNARPKRAEPLIRIAQHYMLTEDWHLCFMYAKRATELEYPKGEHLFVERNLYEYDRYNILAVAAWHLQKYETGMNAVINALKSNPNADHLHNNLKIYKQKMNQ